MIVLDFNQREIVLDLRIAKDITFKTAKWEYQLAEMSDTFDAAQFATFLQARESEHWEFLGSTALRPNGGVSQWLFRRPANTQAQLSRVQTLGNMQLGGVSTRNPLRNATESRRCEVDRSGNREVTVEIEGIASEDASDVPGIAR